MILRQLKQWQFLINVCRKFRPIDRSNPVNLIHHNLCAVGITTRYNSGYEVIRKMASEEVKKRKNRLSKERSPYLLQHAENPVDWYPWGSEAFEKARTEDKLIFLSVGYSTCHWCHVMERESFESEEIAAIMNENFVNVKVDREERPDVDSMYMTFLTASSGSGGWPMSVFLTPTLKPVAGGTYFPPEDRYRISGFKTVLRRIAKAWKDDRADMKKTGDNVIQILKKTTVFDVPLGPALAANSLPNESHVQNCAEQLQDNYDHYSNYGGFSMAPKFPQPSNFEFVFHYYSQDPHQNSPIFDMAIHTLQMMAKGGIHDHVGQGFHRYSTDAFWHIPHFEKMLYDQAQLAVSYCNAYLLTKDQSYADIVHDILTYVKRDLSHEEGGFYSAEDADSLPTFDAKEKKEGAFCAWKYEDIVRLLSKPSSSKPAVPLSEIVISHFDVKEKGNATESQIPENELYLQNIPWIKDDEKDTASKFNISVEQLRADLEEAKKILFQERLKRPKPHLDDKFLTAWNGLMISGFAKAAQALQSEEYKDRAIKAALFIKNHLWCPEKKQLYRCCYSDEAKNVVQISKPVMGFLNDYSFLIKGLLDLYETCFDKQWLDWINELQTVQDELFWDSEAYGYFDTAVTDDQFPFRLKGDQDGAEPMGNSIAAQNLIRMSCIFDCDQFDEKAEKILQSYSSRFNRVPVAIPAMVTALMMHIDSPTSIYVTGKQDNPETKALLKAVHEMYIPGRVLILADDSTDSILYQKNGTVNKMKPVGSIQAAYVCKKKTCSLPVTSLDELVKLLSPVGAKNQ